MLVDNLIWHIYRAGTSSGFVEIDPGCMLLDAGEASGYYYSGCFIVEFDVAALWFMGATKLLLELRRIPYY
jgi:hypothetical protein